MHNRSVGSWKRGSAVMQFRKSILVLVVLVECARFAAGTSHHPDDLSFYDSKRDRELICVADGHLLDSAIDWIYPIPRDPLSLPKISTHLEPELNSSIDHCNFSTGKVCNQFWISDSWTIERNSSLNFIPIIDGRWESFPLIFTRNESSIEKVHLPSGSLKIGVSVRGSQSVQVLLCEGWDVNSYPCFSIDLNETNRTAIVKKYKEGLSSKTGQLLKTASLTPNLVLSAKEWRTYVIDMRNSTIELKDALTDLSVLNVTDQDAPKRLYLLPRSVKPALWRIHKNDFIKAQQVGTYKFGKLLELKKTNTCLTFQYATCANCRLVLYLNRTGNEEVLANLTSLAHNASRWEQARMFIIVNSTVKYVQIFSRLETVKGSKNDSLLWAVDDIRECATTEIRISRLNVSNLNKTDEISCQSMKHPELRPNKQILPEFKELPKLSFNSTSTSIEVTWKDSAEIESIHPHYYTISYTGEKQCENDSKDVTRELSADYDIVRNKNEVSLKNLIPYTHYVFVLKDAIFNKTIIQKPHTKASVVPTEENLPKNMTYDVSNTSASLEWASPPCHSIYGSLVYDVNVTGNGRNFSKTVFQTKFTVDNLDPYRNYTAVITTRIHSDPREQSKAVDKVFNFTTLPGIAPPPQQVQVYSTDSNLVNIKYRLPSKPSGVPISLLVKHCNQLYEKKCIADVQKLEKCVLWPDLYCAKVANLMKNSTYNISVSLKNANTSAYGSPATVTVQTISRVPSEPENVTASTINCKDTEHDCHMRINWTYPRDSMGVITKFELAVLTEEIFNKDADQIGEIQETLDVKEDHIVTSYSHWIQYIAYGHTYNVSVKACNSRYCSKAKVIQLNNFQVVNSTKETPQLTATTSDSFTFHVPSTERRLKSRAFVLIVQDYDKSERLKPGNASIEFCHSYGHYWYARSMQLRANESAEVTVGTNEVSKGIVYENSNGTYANKPLEASKLYCVIFVFLNDFDNFTETVFYHTRNLVTKEKAVSSSFTAGAVFMVLIFMLVPLGFVYYRYVYKRNVRWWLCRRGATEPAYEYIPTAYISNGVYDSSDISVPK